MLAIDHSGNKLLEFIKITEEKVGKYWEGVPRKVKPCVRQ